METLSSNEREAAPFLLFRIRQHLCALPLAHVVEIMRPLPITAIAGVPAAVKGLSVIRGTPLPVIDLGILLGSADEAPIRFITARTGANQVVLGVESIVGVFNLSADTLRAIPPLLSEAAEHIVTAIGAVDAELLLILNAAHLVPESVWLAINAPGEPS